MTQEELNNAIYDMAQDEVKDLAKLVKKASKSDKSIDELEDYRDPLSLDITKEVNILLSWGGPSDGYKLRFDKDNELLGGVYWFADWGTYSDSQLTDEQAETVYQAYLYGDISSIRYNN